MMLQRAWGAHEATDIRWHVSSTEVALRLFKSTLQFAPHGSPPAANVDLIRVPLAERKEQHQFRKVLAMIRPALRDCKQIFLETIKEITTPHVGSVL